MSRIKFWGTRGSCPVSGAEYAAFGGNTLCLELFDRDSLLLIDAGTGIRPAGCQIMKKQIRRINLFLSHTHWDHLLGLPFFEPLYHPETQLTLWAPQSAQRSCPELIEQLFSSEFFPVPFRQIADRISFRTIEAHHPVKLGSMQIDFHPTNHTAPTLCFKIQTSDWTICYATDHEIEPESDLQKSLTAFMQGSDILIHEAQYSAEEYRNKEGWGHSSIQATLSLIEEICPKKWLVTHHDPQHTDADLQHLEKSAKSYLTEKKIRCPVEWVRDGYKLDL